MEFSMEERLAMVRGAIIGALRGGHMEGPEGYEYSRHILLQIAGFLNMDIPGENMTRYKSSTNEDSLFLPPDTTLE